MKQSCKRLRCEESIQKRVIQEENIYCGILIKSESHLSEHFENCKFFGETQNQKLRKKVMKTMQLKVLLCQATTVKKGSLCYLLINI